MMHMGKIRTFLQRIQLAAPQDEGQTVWRETAFRNTMRLRLFIIVVAFIAAGLAFYWYRIHDIWYRFPHFRIFFWIDVAAFGSMLPLGIALYLRWPRSPAQVTRFHDYLLTAFGFLVLAWMAVSSAYEQLSTGNVTHYIIAVFALAAIFYLRSLPLLILYILSFGIFYALVIHLSTTEISFFRNYINLFTLIPLAWISSRVLYAANARDILNRVHIARANRLLQNEISERKQAEVALKTSEQRLALHFGQTPLGVIDWDLDFKVTAWNPAAEQIFGYTAEDAIGCRPEELILPEESLDHVNGVWKALLTQRGGRRSNNKNIRKNGRLIDCEWYNTPLVAHDGSVIGVASLVLDTTERIQAEKEKKELEDRLARSQKMEALGLLAGGVAHDLNNVLSGVVSYPDLLLLEIKPDDPMRKHLETIQDSGLKASTIVQDLLTLARRGVTTRKIVNLNEIILEYLDSPEHKKLLAYHPGVDISKSLESNLLNTIGSPVHIKKMVMNLISNAAEAQPDGGSVKVSTTSCSLDNPVEGYDKIEKGDYVKLCVADEGTGITAEDMDRIFEPFYTKKVMGRSGTGLGMAVVWGTVQDHKGYINVKSDVGRGTEFEIFLPLTRKQIASREKPLPLNTYQGNGENVLVIDDVASQRDIASRILGKLNYTVTTMDSGEAAVEYLRTNTADLILLDMIMDPGIDGLETYRRIIAEHPGQKAIIASGYAETDRVRKTQDLGAGAYVKKPYTLEKIGIAVRNELNK